MRNRALILLAIVTGSLLSRYSAGSEEFPKIGAAPGAKIGIVSILGTEVTNAGGGYTAFSRYMNRLANDWELARFSIEKTKDLLEQSGYQAVELSLDRKDLDEIASGDDVSDLNFDGLSRGWKVKYGQIMGANELAAVVVLRENQWPLTNSRDDRLGHGYIVSSSFGFFKATEILLSVTADAIGGVPPHRSVGMCLARDKFDPKSLPVKNLKDATISDLAPLRERFKSLLERKIKFDLASSGLLAEHEYCPSWFAGGRNVDPATRSVR